MGAVGKQGRLLPGVWGYSMTPILIPFVYSDFTYWIHAKRQDTRITELFPKPCQFWVQSDVFKNNKFKKTGYVWKENSLSVRKLKALKNKISRVMCDWDV